MAFAEKLSVEKVLDFIRPGGQISRHLKGFEVRDQQLSMLSDVTAAYNNNSISLIQAGTGTGKSMAYLLPALLWSAKYGERTVISTHSITLQQQLVQKELPMLMQALGLSLKVVLAKGMSNYICMRKCEETEHSYAALSEKEKQEWREFTDVATTDGSRNELPFTPSASLWERAGAELDTCTWNRCPFFTQCHFVKARQNALDAHIVVVNHHLLFADLSRRAALNNYKDPAVLPPYTRLIIDEAHHIEDVATEYFAFRLSRREAAKLMTRLAGEKQSKLADLKRVISSQLKSDHSLETKQILQQISIDLPILRREIIQGFSDLFDCFESFVWGQKSLESGEHKMRIVESHLQERRWQNSIASPSEELYVKVLQFTTEIQLLVKNLEKVLSKSAVEQNFTLFYESNALACRLQEQISMIKNFACTPCEKNHVRWAETFQGRSQPNIHLIDAELDVSKKLEEFLFQKFSTIILCSATITINNRFDFFKKRMGLDSLENRALSEHIYHSPFDYLKQALLLIPTDMPLPASREFTQSATECIWLAVEASCGSSLVLFTSYQMLQTCYQLLQKPLLEKNYHPLKQGEESRYSLLTRFKNTKRSVLFATYSFWEGVDITGEALKCVIIVKLPFKVPSEPIIQARSEAVVESQGDPFYDYALPLAAVKFQQGFGRLIRHKRDRGCILCLDSRLVQKSYGAFFLSGLPTCQKVFATTSETINSMREFYKKTHYLTK